MNKGRLESLSDGVIAIIITVMIFNLKPPVDSEYEFSFKLAPTLLSYFESFFLIGIFWYKHNKLLVSLRVLNRRVFWANHFFLFCLSLIPLVTTWSTQSPDATWPRFYYGTVLLACFISFFIIQFFLKSLNIKAASIILLGNVVSIVLSLFNPWIAYISFGILGFAYLLTDEK